MSVLMLFVLRGKNSPMTNRQWKLSTLFVYDDYWKRNNEILKINNSIFIFRLDCQLWTFALVKYWNKPVGYFEFMRETPKRREDDNKQIQYGGFLPNAISRSLMLRWLFFFVSFYLHIDHTIMWSMWLVINEK